MEPNATDMDVAIIGMNCRFPGADNPEQFWRTLRDGLETVSFFTDAQLLSAGAEAHAIQHERYVKAGQVLADADAFDAPLFQIPREEAELIDPQQRVFLECALAALENSGHDPARFAGPIGVYAGVGLNSYAWQALAGRFQAGSALDRHRLMLANDKDFLSTRVSYKLNLRGPSVNVNTACSTSLVAVHLACLSLLGGECDMALAGSAHVRVPQVEGYLHQDGMIFSPDGHCRPFDADARGTVIGSGVGVVVLRRLQDALAHGDLIRAVIKGSAINNDGARKAGYAAPSAAGQAAVIATAQRVADCPPETIGYVEAHGTGTALGDPIEVAALNEAFSSCALAPGSCPLGSVKSNIGHLDAAAGMAGLIKAVLMLEHGHLVPSLNFKEPNPNIDFAGGPFYVNTELTEWPNRPWPRRAGVSSFGIGGTNAHVVLEQAPPREPSQAARGPQLLIISADTPAALQRAGNALARHLRVSAANLRDAATTLALGRREYRHRMALVAEETGDAAFVLAMADPDRIWHGERGQDDLHAAFVCTGSLPDGGAHAASLYRELAQFRDLVDSLLPADAPDGEAALTSGGPVAAALAEYALGRLWASWGVEPAAVVGLDAGWRAASCLAGATDTATMLDPGASTLATRAPRIPLWLSQAHAWQAADSQSPAVRARTMAAETTDHALRAALDGTGWSALGLYPDAAQASEDGLWTLLRSVGQAWTSGAAIDWSRFHAGQPIRHIELPAYPFERTRYWIDDAARAAMPALREQLRRLSAQQQEDLLVQHLREQIGAVLDMKSMDGDLPDPDQDLFDLDVESLILIEIAAKLSDELGYEIPLTVFVDHRTIRGAVASFCELPGYPGAGDPEALFEVLRETTSRTRSCTPSAR